MVKIFFTPQSKKELKEIKRFISINSPLQAERVIDKIIEEVQKIAKHLK